MGSFTSGGKRPKPHLRVLALEFIPVHILLKPRQFRVVKSGAPETRVIELEPQRPDQVQAGAGIRAQADDVPGIRRYLGLVQDNVQHRLGTIAEKSPARGKAGRAQV
jgi:hypothetical protein